MAVAQEERAVAEAEILDACARLRDVPQVFIDRQLAQETWRSPVRMPRRSTRSSG